MDVFVLGFALTEDKKAILLIKKNRPAWQKGLLNGVGGKVNPVETPKQAMIREGFEETGLYLKWDHRGYMTGINNDGSSFHCDIFSAVDDQIWKYNQPTDEKPAIYRVEDIIKNRYPMVQNLGFLIPYVLCDDRSTIQVVYHPLPA